MNPAPPDPMRTSGRSGVRRTGHWAALVSIAVWAVAALHPTAASRAAAVWPLWPLPHLGTDWTLADGLRNLALTAPLGAALALAHHRWRSIAAATAGLSLGIELAQSFVPGRHASVVDIALNTAGAGLGALAIGQIRAAAGLADAAAGRRALLAGAVAAGLVAVAAVAARPDCPGPVQQPAKQARLPWISVASPLVLEARIGDRVVPPFRPTTGADSLERALCSERVLTVRWRFTGRSAGWVVPLLRQEGDEGRSWVVGVDGRDVVWHWPLVGRRIGLENVTWRWRDALAGRPVDEPAEIEWRFDGAGVDAHLADGGSFRRRMGPGETWRLIVATSSTVSRRAVALGSAAWLAVVWLPIGVFARRSAWTLAALGLAGTALVAAPLAGLGAPGFPDWAGATAGLALGALAARSRSLHRGV